MRRIWYCSASVISWSRNPSSLAAAFDQRHLDAQRRHHAGILDADDAAADDDHRLGQLLELQQRVGGEDRLVIERDVSPAVAGRVPVAMTMNSSR